MTLRYDKLYIGNDVFFFNDRTGRVERIHSQVEAGSNNNFSNLMQQNDTNSVSLSGNRKLWRNFFRKVDSKGILENSEWISNPSDFSCRNDEVWCCLASTFLIKNCEEFWCNQMIWKIATLTLTVLKFGLEKQTKYICHDSWSKKLTALSNM